MSILIGAFYNRKHSELIARRNKNLINNNNNNNNNDNNSNKADHGFSIAGKKIRHYLGDISLGRHAGGEAKEEGDESRERE